MADVNFRAGAVLKEEFPHVVEQMGLTVTAALNAFMRATVQQRAIPFRFRGAAEPAADEKESLTLLNDAQAESFRPAHHLAGADGGIVERRFAVQHQAHKPL